jgi:glycolate oxidase
MTPAFIEQLRKILGNDRVVTAADELMVYECDAYVIERAAPQAVVFPQTTLEVQQVVRALLLSTRSPSFLEGQAPA